MHNTKEPNIRKRIVVGGLAALLLVLSAVWVLFTGESDQVKPNIASDISPPPASAPAALPAMDSVTTPNPESDYPPVELNLRLLAVTVSSDGQFSRATIEDVNRECRHLMRPGQQLRGYEDVVLSEIDTDRVIFANNGREEIIYLDTEVPLNPRKQVWPLERDLFPDAEEPADITEGVFLHGIARQIAVLQTQRSAFALGHQGAFAPWQENGEFIGVMASNVVNGSFYDQLGLRQGDILMSVNGYDIKSAADTDKILEMFTKETSLELRVRGSDGKEREFITHTVPVS